MGAYINKDLKISIHAPHEGERQTMMCRLFRRTKISIHAPHEGERPFSPLSPSPQSRFQSTLPTRGSDFYDIPVALENGEQFQSTLPTRGSDKEAGFADELIENISIHAPHEGERHIMSHVVTKSKKFQSTLPTRGSDDGSGRTSPQRIHFNPRSPRGGATQH